MSSALKLSLLILGLGMLFGCGSSGENGTPADSPQSLVVYSGRGEALVGPLLTQFEEQSGIQLDIRYNDTATLATQLHAEGEATPAQVFLAQDSGHLGALARDGFLLPLDDSLLSSVERRFRDGGGRWVGTSGRLRVLVYDPTRISAEDMPGQLRDLADLRFKDQVGWAPSNGSFQAHLSALIKLWGEAETRSWLQAMDANGTRRYPKNSPQVRAVNGGEISIGWVNHYYLHKLGLQGAKTQNWSFPKAGDAGNLMMVSGVGLVKGVDQNPAAKEAAEKLIAFLISRPAQEHFAQELFEYPTRPGVATHPDVPSLESIGLVALGQESLIEVDRARALLEEIGLQ